MRSIYRFTYKLEYHAHILIVFQQNRLPEFGSLHHVNKTKPIFCFIELYRKYLFCTVFEI